VKDIDLIHELALIEDRVRTDLAILRSDPRPPEDRSNWSQGFDSAVLPYAIELGLINASQIDDNGWII